jgi:hypothetical protein
MERNAYDSVRLSAVRGRNFNNSRLMSSFDQTNERIGANVQGLRFSKDGPVWRIV